MIRFLSHPPEIVPHEAVLTNLMPSEQEPNDGDRNECCQDGQYNQEPHRISLYDRMNPHGPSTICTQRKNQLPTPCYDCRYCGPPLLGPQCQAFLDFRIASRNVSCRIFWSNSVRIVAQRRGWTLPLTPNVVQPRNTEDRTQVQPNASEVPRRPIFLRDDVLGVS